MTDRARTIAAALSHARDLSPHRKPTLRACLAIKAALDLLREENND